MTHELKTWPEYFEHVFSGDKTFELRRNDRPFKVGDILHLREWNPTNESYTGRKIKKGITYIFQGGEFGVEPEYIIMSLKQLPANHPEDKP